MATNDLIAGQAGTDSQWVPRVRSAFLKACPAIQNEASGTVNHTARLALVGRILGNPDGYAQRFASLIAVDATVAAQSTLAAATDVQVENAVNGVLDMLALQGV